MYLPLNVSTYLTLKKRFRAMLFYAHVVSTLPIAMNILSILLSPFPNLVHPRLSNPVALLLVCSLQFAVCSFALQKSKRAKEQKEQKSKTASGKT